MPLNIFLAKIFKLLTSPTKGKLSMPLVHRSRSSPSVSILGPETSINQPRDDLLGLGRRLDLMTFDIIVDILSYLDFYDFLSARLVSAISLTTSIMTHCPVICKLFYSGLPHALQSIQHTRALARARILLKSAIQNTPPRQAHEPKVTFARGT